MIRGSALWRIPALFISAFVALPSIAVTANHPDDVFWTDRAPYAGVNYPVSALAKYESGVVAAGAFGIAGGVNVQHVAYWNGERWDSLANGVAGEDAPVHCMTEYNGLLVASGSFSGAGGNPAPGMATWNGNSWTPFSAGVSGSIKAMCEYQGLLFVGGQFSAIEGMAANSIAAWNGTSWTDVDGGCNGSIECMTVADGALVIGGSFTDAGGVSVRNIAEWDGVSWSTMDGGTNGSIADLEYFAGNLVALGAFDSAGTTSCNGFATWDGNLWSAAADSGDWLTPMQAYDIGSLAVFEGLLYAGGSFLTVGSENSCLARWDGVTWELAPAPGYSVAITNLIATPTELYASGSFGGWTGENIFILRFNGERWRTLGDGFDEVIYGFTEFQGEAIAVGEFVTAGGYHARGVAKLTDTGWAPLGSGPEFIPISATEWNSNLVVSGDHGSILAKWDGTDWSTLGAWGGDHSYRVNSVCSYGGNLIAGGEFDTVGGITASNIAAWNGAEWSALGNGLPGRVYALLVRGGLLYAAGQFAVPGGQSYGIGVWDGSVWSDLGDGLPAAAYCLCEFNQCLVAGGGFGISIWDDTTWTAIPGGGSPAAIAQYGTKLIADGSAWDGVSWSGLGSGAGGEGTGILALLPIDEKLLVGGNFTVAGGQFAKSLASWWKADSDSDGVWDIQDNCQQHFNPLQEDTNNNLIGDLCEQGYTAVGSDVIVTPSDNAHVTFDSVTTSGFTTLSASSSGEPPPDGFSVIPLNSPQYFDVSTTAVFVPPVSICFEYDDALLAGLENDMRLLHFVGDEWIDVTTALDTSNNSVCGEVATLSPFAVTVPCKCSCTTDPQCDGVMSDVLDVVQSIGVAFRGESQQVDPIATCPTLPTDVNCSGATDVVDIVLIVNVAFRGATTGTQFCNPCP